jgi:Integrase core domain
MRRIGELHPQYPFAGARMVCDEYLNVHQFASLAEALTIIEIWRVDCNTQRPHRSLRHLTPSKFVTQRHDERTVEEALYFAEELFWNGANVMCQSVFLYACLPDEKLTGPKTSREMDGASEGTSVCGGWGDIPVLAAPIIKVPIIYGARRIVANG